MKEQEPRALPCVAQTELPELQAELAPDVCAIILTHLDPTARMWEGKGDASVLRERPRADLSRAMFMILMLLSGGLPMLVTRTV